MLVSFAIRSDQPHCIVCLVIVDDYLNLPQVLCIYVQNFIFNATCSLYSVC